MTVTCTNKIPGNLGIKTVRDNVGEIPCNLCMHKHVLEDLAIEMVL